MPSIDFDLSTKDSARNSWKNFMASRGEPVRGEPVRKSPLNFTHNVATDEGEILIYDEIGMWTNLTSQSVSDMLARMPQYMKKLTIRINSPGGDVFEGIGIYNLIKGFKALEKVTVIEGLAASAASFIALAADKIQIHENAFMMVHRASCMCCGNVNDLQKTCELLGKLDEQIAQMMADKCGKTKDECLALVDAETWLTSDEAIALGIVDEVIPNVAKCVPPVEAEPENVSVSPIRAIKMKMQLALSERRL